MEKADNIAVYISDSRCVGCLQLMKPLTGGGQQAKIADVSVA